uniref:MSCRAMM family protein n=1 Tax=Marinilactibacillus kalidii TaxID=2820274 RepID=UPI0024469E08
QATIPGYELDQTPQSFEVVLGQTETIELSFENERTPGSVELMKVNPDGEALEGAIFRLEDAEGNELEIGLTTDEAGLIRVENLLPGDYHFIETQAPSGYILDETPLEFTIDFNQSETIELVVENTPDIPDIPDIPDERLPQTGYLDLLVYKLTGLFLLSSAVSYLLYSKSKKRNTGN